MSSKSICYNNQYDVCEKIAVKNGSGRLSKIFLSPLSTEILNAALDNRISVVFTQGPLRLSPLISAILTSDQKSDVLLGVPRKQFNELSSDYEASFLSLYDEHGTFFYEKVLWCTADIDSGNTGFMIKDVATRPKWGRRDYKNKFEAMLSFRLSNGFCNNWPRVLCIPIDSVVPDNLLGNTIFTFRRHRYKLSPFSPKFIILESINERVFSAEPVIALMKSLGRKSVGAVIHFSWPYVPSVARLLDSVPEIEKVTGRPITVIHMGKRYCSEMKDSFNEYVAKLERPPASGIDRFLKDHLGFKEFSIEGMSWNDYYPDPTNIDLKDHLTLGIIDYDQGIGYKSLADLAAAEGPFDSLLEEISSAVYEFEGCGSRIPWRSLILFPPFVDSFLLPEETKLFCENENGEYCAQPIKDAIHKRIGISNPVQGSFTSLCSQMDSVADFLHIVRGISTHRPIGKSTALLCYVFNTIKNWKDPEETLLVCNFNSNVGFKKGMMQRIIGLMDMLHNSPEISSKTASPSDYMKDFVPAGGRLEPPLGEGIIQKLEYRHDSSGRDIEVLATLAHTTEAGASTVSEKRMRILIIDFDQIMSVSSSIPMKKATLLLPGPIPVFSFRDETPVITKGFDGLFRPFKNIVMFTYVGENLKRCLEQINIMDELMSSDKTSPIAQIDLSLSTRQMPRKLVVGIDNPSTMPSTELVEAIHEPEESPLDVCIRKRIISGERKTTELRAKTLQEVWDSIAGRGPAVLPTQPSYSSSLADISFEVRFLNDMHIERISLNPISYVRVVEAQGTSLCLAENLVRGKKIAYIRSDKKESLDNFFIRNFSEPRGWTLEEVFEPFTCLSHFYEALSEADFGNGYLEEQFSRLHWLSPDQRKTLFTIVRFLLKVHPGRTEELFADWTQLVRNPGIWSSLRTLTRDELLVIKKAFQESSLLTPEKLYLIASAMGMIYDPSSFKSTINQVVSGEKRYYFQNPENLLAIGRLLENSRIIERYEEITDAGKAVRVVLEMEGFAISRVIAGKENPLSDMDTIVKERMMICEILRRVE